MKKYFIIIASLLVLASCKKENEVEEKVAEIPVGKVKIERFDKQFYEAGPDGLAAVKAQYPYFFPAGNDDAVWLNKMKDPLLQELHGEVEKTFPNTTTLEQDLHSLFQHTKFYFKGFREPKVVTLISEMDYNNRIIFTDSLLLISLDLYLGKDHRYYADFPKYQSQLFEQSQIMPDVVSAFSMGKIAPPTDKTLLSQMIYYGKELYLKDLLIPEVSDENKIGYTKEQMEWAQANESEIWRYFVDRKLLYDTDLKLPGRFISPAPFSKFYLELDNESPGRIGQWIGWQIVRSYAENNKDVPLQQILAMDAKTIFDNSKYKPKK
ncbi:gliding motility lipoprotein GldB [Flavobacterium album]|uniref:Gliding motility lipoprotein GldB n=1 Tax=Flavobacterium album TaxID=2175091 RepID=A0A2S1QUA4_9FLAO|nr:gliding motility lipoprotein GldB [Flavobacterium album]AWH83953.1 gliding motility lipoprotein GldB [Flavobacterium album]